MKKLIPVFFVLLVAAMQLNGQKLTYETYDWEESPKPSALAAEDEKEPAVVLNDVRIMEFAYDSPNELLLYSTRHQVTRVNSEKAIEQLNKLYIPMSGAIDVLNIKARSISKDGKVTMLNKSNIKDIENFEDKGPYKIFAFEGVEAGSTIEYMYTLKRPARFWGSEYMQSNTKRNNTRLEIISPRNLVYEARAYNTTATPVTDTLANGNNHILFTIPFIPRLNDETYSTYEANLLRVEYKLAYNKVKGKMRLFTWDNAAAFLYNSLYTFDKKELSSAQSLIKQLKLSKIESDEEKVRAFESYIKNNIIIGEGEGEDAERVNRILEKKSANDNGIMRLYIAVLKQLNIGFDLVITTDRFEKRFDPDFDTWNYVDKQFLHLKDLGIYIAPTEQFGRMGYISPELTGTKGLFINEISLGDVSSATARVKDIKTPGVEKSSHDIDVKVDFSASIEEPKVQLEQRLLGYSGSSIQPIYNYLNQEQKEEMTKEVMKLLGDDSKTIKAEILNTDEASLYVKPLVIKGEVTTPSIIEKAGNKYLFKLGLLIGKQQELYQEENRQMRAEVNYLHSFTRKIEFIIPEGYTITNPDDIKINAVCKEGDQVTAEFRSSYEINGNKVTVQVTESYKALVYPLSIFEDFRKVINAAADFNKVTLILEKK